MELPPFLAPCSSTPATTGVVPAGIVLAHHPAVSAGQMSSAVQQGPTCWTLYSQEGDMPGNGGAQHSPPTVALCLDSVNGGGRQGPKIEPPEYGGQAPITFHILTTHAAQPLEHYFTTNATPVPAERRLGMPPPAGVSGPPKMLGIGIGRLCHWTVWGQFVGPYP